jgi:hypothetical protein
MRFQNFADLTKNQVHTLTLPGLNWYADCQGRKQVQYSVSIFLTFFRSTLPLAFFVGFITTERHMAQEILHQFFSIYF